MTKRTLAFFVIMLLHISTYAQRALTIDEAIFEGMNYVSQNAPPSAKVVVLNVECENGDLADYIVVECKNHIVNNTFLSSVNTKKLTDILREKNIDDLNAVDDRTLAEVAGLLGAEFAIQGRFWKQSENYNLTFRIIDVEKTQIVGMLSGLVRLDEILADFTGETYNPSNKDFDDKDKELEELRKQMRELKEKNDSALAVLEARKNEEQAVRNRLEAEAEAARQAKQAQIEAKKASKNYFVFSFRPEFVSGSAVMGAGASVELGAIGKESFYFSTELSGGAVYYGGLLNIGRCIGKDGSVKNVLGFSAGYRNMLYFVDFTKNGIPLINEHGQNVSVVGFFWKLLFGKTNNFDISNKFLLGPKKNPVSYNIKNNKVSYDEGFNATYVLGIGYTLSKSKR